MGINEKSLIFPSLAHFGPRLSAGQFARSEIKNNPPVGGFIDVFLAKYRY
jgi:hypothetical protein